MKHLAPPVNVATLTGRFSSLRAKHQSFGELMTCNRVSRLLHYALTASVLHCVLCSDIKSTGNIHNKKKHIHLHLLSSSVILHVFLKFLSLISVAYNRLLASMDQVPLLVHYYKSLW